MKVAVTGAAGFVGTNLVNQLVADGHDVVAIDRVSPAHGLDHPQVTWTAADIFDHDALVAAFDGVDTVYHLVAMITLKQQDELAWRVNTQGVASTARAALAAGVRRFVHCSSIHSFDQYTDNGIVDENSARSENPALPVYDRSKWAGEQELRKVIADGLDAVICNPTGVYGPVDHGLSRINGMLRDAAQGRVPLFVEGNFDLVDVRDVAKGLTLAAAHGATGENYLLGGEQVCLFEAMRAVAELCGRFRPLFAVPLRLLNVVVPIAEPISHLFGSDLVSRASIAALVAQPVVDISKARTQLGYEPRPSADTLADLVSFLCDSKQMGSARPRSGRAFESVLPTPVG
ncbi:NAD-dependent epimerase/dehydratase family protein [Gordonia sp. PS3]|uniref:NAD-dependent epimerase/dehydratase family protein n=1 Tax=Gordonia sihwensis NBRC 108236 TaxID=1223544 RepID=L7LGG7_9ACTN|nr:MULTISPECIES: NAD-dependent epimerase/dehydratase family protein [Gordonia]AUH70297.1 epimerase [Gordonia sp. YC-JH1]MBY4570813.1 epimerase [Gordonia sihwensis]WFN91216.1 NAD-dependent epimerase/dehydratase family protein [Gordonia sihwensis]GAC59836.1 NAD-dependent epimerase/dehydratase family protein [Gordonia sihwensis NBRC 108236]